MDFRSYVREHLPNLGVQREDEIVEELAQHLDDVYRDGRAGGLAHDAAWAEATNALPKAADELAAALCHASRAPAARAADAWRTRLNEPPTTSRGAVLRDLVYAARTLARARTFTLVCVVSLGIGMGAIVALATFGRALTAPARGIDTEGLTEVLVLPQGPLRLKAGVWATEQWSYPDYQALRDGATGMALTGWASGSSEVGMKGPDEAERRRVTTLYVSANYFSTFGVTLARGPGFDPARDDAMSGEPRVILGHDFWRIQTSSDADVVGKSLLFDGVPHTVVGVAPDGFRGHFHVFQAPGSLVFIPLEQHPRLTANPDLRHDRSTDWVRIHGRLNPGVDLPDANAMVASLVSDLAQRYPLTNQFKSATVEPYASMGAAGRPESRRMLSIMLGLAGSVLLVVCLNISGMMLVRGTIRERELSIRSALGAARQRLIQLLFFEALVLAAFAAAISGFVLFGIPAIAGWYVGVPVPEEIGLDAVNILIASGLCLVVSLLFGLLPAIRFSRPNLISAMKDDAGGGGTRTIRVHRLAVMVQIGIAVPFLVTSGVMLDRVRTADLGFAVEGLAAAKVRPPAESDRDASFSLRRVLDDRQRASGVRAAAVAQGMPVDFDYREFRVAGAGGETFVTAHVTHVGENFLETIGAPLHRGRTITAEDRMAAAAVAVISQPLADALFPGREPIGERVTVTLDESQESEFIVIGVSADFATSQLTTTRLQILLPMPETFASTVYLIARGAPGSDPQLKAALETALREWGVEPLPGVAFPGIVIGQDLLDKSTGDLISESMAVGVAGGLVLVLAVLGIVGVIGFVVATRTREIAVRMALGSTRVGVFSLMLWDIVKLVVPGVAVGLVIAALLIRTMGDVMGTPLMLGPDSLGLMEPVIYACAALLAMGAALLAGVPAARRATRVQPMVAMRAE
jgi:putative ABC transport system permease protein